MLSLSHTKIEKGQGTERKRRKRRKRERRKRTCVYTQACTHACSTPHHSHLDISNEKDGEGD
jgi:hypothetical protein